MTFHPESLKLTGDLKAKNDTVTERTVLYQGISCIFQWCYVIGYWLLASWQMIITFFGIVSIVKLAVILSLDDDTGKGIARRFLDHLTHRYPHHNYSCIYVTLHDG